MTLLLAQACGSHYERVTLVEPFSIRKTTIFVGITLVRESKSHLLMAGGRKKLKNRVLGELKNYGQVFA